MRLKVGKTDRLNAYKAAFNRHPAVSKRDKVARAFDGLDSCYAGDR